MVDLESWIRNATVKVIVGGSQGTGFFIPPDGYIVTAYHCIYGKGNSRDHTLRIIVNSHLYGEMDADLQEEKSLPLLDIAVLRVNRPSACKLPLGHFTKIFVEKTEKTVCSAGYPLIEAADEPSFYKTGEITNLKMGDKDFLITNTVIGGEGHSGGAIFHYASNTVIGIAKEVPGDSNRGSDKAAKIEKLFEIWPNLSKINQKYITGTWRDAFSDEDEVELPKPTPLKPNQLTVKDLRDRGILSELAKIFQENTSAREFLKKSLNYPGGRIPIINPSDVSFWQHIFTLVEKGDVSINGGVLAMLHKILENYPNTKISRYITMER